MRSGYNTRQKEAVRAFLEMNRDKTFTASQIYAAVGDGVGRTTVYRALYALERDGDVQRFPADGRGADGFQFRVRSYCQGHVHFKCIKCGSVGHLDCGFMKELYEHVFNGHHFSIDNEKTVLYGTCRECMGK